MTVSARFTFLGTGSSGGVPRVGNDWGDCDPQEPRNRRRRCCVLVDTGDLSQPDACTRVLIDSSPDLREQLLDAGVGHLDALVFTHHHADQAHGIDDVRALALRMRQTIPTYMDDETANVLTSRFDYCFRGTGGYPPILDQKSPIVPGIPFIVPGRAGAIEFLPVDQLHGRIRSLGFRMGNLAYCNDLHDFAPGSLDLLRGVDVLVIDALRYTPHPSHVHLELALEWIEELGVAEAWLTNLHIDMDHNRLCEELPAHIRPAYDGLSIEFEL